MLNFFSDLYIEEGDINTCPWLVIQHSFPDISESEATQFCYSFTTSEVLEALRLMGPFKAPGPDGFPVVFYQRQWMVVSKQVIDIVLNLLNSGDLPLNLSNALMGRLLLLILDQSRS